MQTIAELIRLAQRHLRPLASARLDAEVLLAGVLRRERAFLFAHPEYRPPPAARADYRRLIAMRRRGLPVAYLRGTKEFWSLPFAVTADTLVPRPETEALVATALARIAADSRERLLDVGAGCGAVAISIAKHRPRLRVTAVDICPRALAVARRNARALATPNVRFAQSDLLAAARGRRFHCIVSNPPYIDSAAPCLKGDELRHEPRLALDGGEDGLRYLRAIPRQAWGCLYPGGLLLLEHGYDQGPAARGILREHGYGGIQTLRDDGGHARLTLARRPGTAP